MKAKRIISALLIFFVCVGLVGAAFVLCADARVRSVGSKRIISADEALGLTDVDCVLVLGCLVNKDGSPSFMLRDRLMRSSELYKAGAAPKLLMSGDHGRKEYDEVNAMKNYAMDDGIPPEDVFLDHAGFSTYESVYRAKEIFKVEKVIIVTQRYHLYRALYIADAMGLEAYGVDADYYRYTGQTLRDIREVLARAKDFVKCIFKPEPTFLGEAIPVSGNGNVTAG